jgi:hypothetical protein
MFVYRAAKDKKLKIWKDYKAPTAHMDLKDKSFSGKVSLAMSLTEYSET